MPPLSHAFLPTLSVQHTQNSTITPVCPYTIPPFSPTKVFSSTTHMPINILPCSVANITKRESLVACEHALIRYALEDSDLIALSSSPPIIFQELNPSGHVTSLIRHILHKRVFLLILCIYILHSL